MSTCNPNTLLDSGKCFACLTPGEWDLAKAQLLCEIVNAGGGGCVPPEQPTDVVFTDGEDLFNVSWTSATDPTLDFLVEWGDVAGPPFANSQSVPANQRVLVDVPFAVGTYFGRVTARNAVDCVTVGTPDNEPFEVTAPFSPADLPGLALWLKSESITPPPSDPFEMWIDSSGNGNDAVLGTGNPATVSVNTYNGQPAARFFGTVNERLEVQVNLFDGDIPRYLFVVFKAEASFFAGHVCGIAQGAAANDIWWVAYSINFASEPFGSTGGNDVQGNFVQTDLVSCAFYYTDTDGTPRLIACKTGEPIFSSEAAPSPQNTIANNFYIGADEDFNNPFNGDICEIIVCNQELTGAQINATVDYLNAKFGIVPS